MAQILKFKGKKKPRPKSVLLKVASAGQGRKTNSALGRVRDHLTPSEVEALMRAAGKLGRHQLRDRTLILIAYRHGFRVSELIGLRWDQVDFKRATLHVRRAKKGNPATHPLAGDELRALRNLKREYPDSSYIFATERGGPLTRTTFNKLLTRAGEAARIKFPVTPHQLRHACGYYLANTGVPTRTLAAYLGHRSLQSTERYTALSEQAFRGFWG